MNALEDTREIVKAVATDNARAERGLYARAASSALFALLVDYPDVELATLQFRIDSDDPPKVTVTGRRGPLTTDECPSCHTTAGHPHTDYCQTTRSCACPHTTLLGHRNDCPVYGESWRRVRGIDPPLGRGGEGERPGELED